MSVRTIEEMIDWVENNIEKEPTLQCMAEHVCYSKFYSSSKFHEYVGTSFKEYVLKRKLSLAAIKLIKTDERILDIALCYGFSSHEAFSRAFKKYFGYSPNQYRLNKPSIGLYRRANRIDITHH
ncbi:MAG: helix-turn-helix transcriptional regulator [Cellulosilyticaceae bacterium]